MAKLIIFVILSFQLLANDIIGYWLISSEDAVVKIYKVYNEYKGKLKWYLPSNDPSKNMKYDSRNPDQNLQKRLIWDVEVLYGFKKEKDRWVDGKIYNAKEGETYSAVIDLEKNKMILRGYILFEFIGKEDSWRRITEKELDSIKKLHPVPKEYLKK